MMLHVIGAGADGMACLVGSRGSRVLLDCGLPGSVLRTRLETMEVDPLSIDAVVLTHEHPGHARGLPDHPFRTNVPVFASEMTCRLLEDPVNGIEAVRWHGVASGETIVVGSLELCGFPVPHDAIEPLGWMIGEVGGGLRLGVTGDAGHVTKGMFQNLLTADRLLIHAKHDTAMVESDETVDRNAKMRLENRHGHLSNDQAGELAARLAARGRLAGVLSAHLDPVLNSPNRAAAAVREGLGAVGRPEIPVHCLRAGQVHHWE
jgi:phosphoribosyl 1,2-cyclic phosphodiesterase